MKSELSKDAEEFALRVLKMYSFLVQRKKEYVLSKQVLRSGTSIGTNLAEAEYAQTRPDFITKMHNALKEASETRYWLRLLNKGGYLSDKQFTNMEMNVQSLLARLVASLKTVKANLRKEQNG